MCQTRRSAQTVAHIPGNENSGALTTSNHRSIRTQQDTKPFSCRDRPMMMNSIEGL